MHHSKEQIFTDAMRTLAMVLDFDEGEKLNHAWRVGLLSLSIGKAMGHARPDLLYVAGLLHDIGAVGLKDHVIHHAARGFSDPQARLHPERGARIVRPFLPRAGLDRIILDHHERHDGQGFPGKKQGGDVSAEAGVVHMADILDVSLRSSGSRRLSEKALRISRLQKGTTVAPGVAEAAAYAIEDEPDWLDDIFSADGLKKMVLSQRVMPGEIEDYSTVELMGQILWLFSRVIDAKSPSVMGHSVRVAWLATQISQALGPEDLNLWDVAWSGILHDVGVVGVPASLLEHKGPLSENGRKHMARHPAYTVEIMSNIRSVAHLAYAAGSHHERYDGSGYPHGSAGEGIPLLGRLLAFADTYDRLTSSGSGAGLSHEEALLAMRRETGTRLDPHLAETALDVLEACGRTRVETPEVLEDFNRLFSTDQADVASLVNAEQALVTSGGQGFMASGERIWRTVAVDPEGAVAEGREAFRKLFPEADPGRFLSAVAEDGRAFFRERLSAVKSGTDSWEFVDISGNSREVLAVAGGQGVTLHIRGTRALDRPIRKVSMLYQSFLFSHQPVAFEDASGRIGDANKAFGDLFGWSLEELSGHTMADLGIDIQGARSGETRECECAARDGRRLSLLVSVHAILDAAGGRVGRIWHLADITRRKALELELEKKNRDLARLNRLKSDMLAVSSHDMKSPLGTIIGYAGLLRDLKDHIDQEEEARYLNQIIRSARHLERFIQDILDAARIESGGLELFKSDLDLGELVDEVVAHEKPGASLKEVRVEYRPPEEPFLVSADEKRMGQVFANILSNAVKFSPPDGRVEVSCGKNGDGLYRVAVSDQGPGVPPEDREKIFDRYYQVTRGQSGAKSSQGSGLGLYIARKIVEFHGGSLLYEPGQGGGSTFVVTLKPAARK